MICFAVAARHGRVECVARQVELAAEQGVGDGGRLETPPVGVDDGLGRRLSGEDTVAEQLVEHLGLVVGSAAGEAVARLGVQHLGGQALRGGERLTQEGDVLASLAVRERGRFVQGMLPRTRLVERRPARRGSMLAPLRTSRTGSRPGAMDDVGVRSRPRREDLRGPASTSDQ
jgi:hypothetical protein